MKQPKTLLEMVKDYYQPWGYASELRNGNVIGVYPNGEFTEYGKEREGTIHGLIYPYYGYRETDDHNVKKIKLPQNDAAMVRLLLIGGKMVHNRSFAFTGLGILSFITGKIVKLPDGRFTTYHPVVSDNGTYLIVDDKKYTFNGETFTKV